MTEAPPDARITALCRYPVKGLTAETLQTVAMAAGETLPFDRVYAIENGPGPFDPEAPKHLPKIHFVMLMRNEQLAQLRARFDDASHTLILSRDDAEIGRGDLRTEEGRANIEAALASSVTANVRGPPRIVASPEHSFSDVDAKCVHLINLESIRALEAKMGARIDPLRFRANMIIDGWPAWSELDLVGKTLRIGDAAFEVFKRTERCAATNVDPSTGVRDLKIPSFLSRTYGHTDFGVYARVMKGGTVGVGDRVASASAG